MKMRCVKNRAGAVLVETLAASVILAVGLTGIIRSFLSVMEAQQRTREYLTAAVLMENVLTECLTARYFNDETAAAGNGEGSFSAFRHEITPDKEAAGRVLKKMLITVFWLGRRQERSVSAPLYLFSSQGKQEAW